MDEEELFLSCRGRNLDKIYFVFHFSCVVGVLICILTGALLYSDFKIIDIVLTLLTCGTMGMRTFMQFGLYIFCKEISCYFTAFGETLRKGNVNWLAIVKDILLTYFLML